MVRRKTWTPRQLKRQMGHMGLITSRPALAFQIRADRLPPLRWALESYRWYHLEELGWPDWLIELLRPLDHGWKYVNLFTPRAEHPGHHRIVLRAYRNEPTMPLLPAVVELIHGLQEHGIQVEVE